MAPKDKPFSADSRKTAVPASNKTTAHEGERIAKVLSRRGIASRRDAERLIETGEVRVNGKIITSPALNVTASDRIVVSGRPLPAEEPARLWLYYKPEGLVTSASDEKGRDTVFDHLPEDMPRVMSVGRLDLNSEGLLLLTNDGELKRRLELPSTGWLRKYRVRVNGTADDLRLQILREGITIDGEKFKPMQVTIDRQQGANAWLTVGLREGKNREIRRAMNEIGLYVNRLIRVSYGPFRLGELRPGEVEEVKSRVLRDQLGEQLSDVAPEPLEAAPSRPGAPRGASGPKSAAPRPRREAAGESGAEARRPARSPNTGTGTGTGSSRTPSRAPAREGDGLRTLSRSWSEATTPRPGPKVRVSHSGAAKRAGRGDTYMGESASAERSYNETGAPSRGRSPAASRGEAPSYGRRSSGPASADSKAPARRSPGFAAETSARPAARGRDSDSREAERGAGKGFAGGKSFGANKTFASAARGSDPASKAPGAKAPARRGPGFAGSDRPAAGGRDSESAAGGRSFGAKPGAAPRSSRPGSESRSDRPRSPSGKPGPKRPPRG